MTAHIDPPRKAVNADQDAVETADWLASLGSLHHSAGAERVRYILAALDRRAKELGVLLDSPPFSPYRNSIPLEQQKPYPGDIAIETRLTAIIRWNALAMVVRANKAYGELGGHVASYASAAEIFEVGFNHFFRASSSESEGDLVYFQPHSSPGVYARAYLEGRLSDENLKLYRQELSGPGLSSYPHPWLMPEFWQVPIGVDGHRPDQRDLPGAVHAYLQHRGLVADGWSSRLGRVRRRRDGRAGIDRRARPGGAGESRQPDLRRQLQPAAPRWAGPRQRAGDSGTRISFSAGAGWNVIKVLWGSDWDDIFARDIKHALLREFADTVDGKYQTLGAKDGRLQPRHSSARIPRSGR